MIAATPRLETYFKTLLWRSLTCQSKKLNNQTGFNEDFDKEDVDNCDDDDGGGVSGDDDDDDGDEDEVAHLTRRFQVKSTGSQMLSKEVSCPNYPCKRLFKKL